MYPGRYRRADGKGIGEYLAGGIWRGRRLPLGMCGFHGVEVI